MRKRLASQGFTIIETVFVLSLIAVIAALALPRLGGAANQRELEMVAQNLVSDIRLAQQLSINSGDLKECSVYFVSERGGQQYYLISDGGYELKRVYLPKTIKWVSARTIRFTVTGIPALVSNTSSAQTIRLESSGCSPLFIKIAPVTGRIRVTNVESAGNE